MPVAAERTAIDVADLEQRAHEGNPAVVRWCPKCAETALPMWDGTCGWCNGELEDVAAAEGVPERQEHRTNGRTRSWTRDLILDRIRGWDDAYGAPPTKTDWHPGKLLKMAEAHAGHGRVVAERLRRFHEGDWPTEKTVREIFGSVNAARAEAGYAVMPTGRPARSAVPVTSPKVGEAALRGYYRDVATAREAGDHLALKAGLYTLAMSAIREADRIDGGS